MSFPAKLSLERQNAGVVPFYRTLRMDEVEHTPEWALFISKLAQQISRMQKRSEEVKELEAEIIIAKDALASQNFLMSEFCEVAIASDNIYELGFNVVHSPGFKNMTFEQRKLMMREVLNAHLSDNAEKNDFIERATRRIEIERAQTGVAYRIFGFYLWSQQRFFIIED